MKQDTLPLKDAFRDLANMSKLLEQLSNKGKKYDVIINYLAERDFGGDENPYPLLKDAAQEIGISYSKFKTLTLQLYEDVRLDENFLFEEVSVRYTFNYHKKDKHITISFKELKVVPRVGEDVCLPFFRAYIPNWFFHVKSISHDFYRGLHEVNIELGEFSYNHYWKIRLDEAKLRHEISLHEENELSDSELQEKLGFLPYWKRLLRR